jgi:hypothetical protein
MPATRAVDWAVSHPLYYMLNSASVWRSGARELTRLTFCCLLAYKLRSRIGGAGGSSMAGPTSRTLARVIAAATAAGLASLAFSSVVQAAGTGQNGYTATNYSTGYPNSGLPNGVGPIGVVFDASGVLYVTDNSNGGLYLVPPGGGAATLLQTNHLFGLTESNSGRLYADDLSGNVVELNKATGMVIRTLINVSSALGIATDPLSGDLFVATPGHNGIDRVSHIEDLQPVTDTVYATGFSADGISFGPDGTIYAAATSSNLIYSVTGTNQPQPATASVFVALPVPDGTAVATATTNGFLAVNRNDGIITAVDLVTKATLDIVINGSRGDFETVGPDHCLYATQTDLIEKVTKSDGTCAFVPPPALIPEVPSVVLLSASGILAGVGVVGYRRRQAARRPAPQ